MILKYLNYYPEIGKKVFIAPSADVIGRCEIGDDSSIWFGTVIRGDVHYIKIGKRTSIQDGSMIHVTHYKKEDMSDGNPTIIGDDVTVGHKVMLHGCTKEDACMDEVTDINDLDNYIKMAQDSKADDVIQSFEILRDGSYSHYWAFDKGLKNIGISDGCCSLGKVDGVDYCHNEYPTHEHNEDGEHNIDTVEQQHIDTHQENKKGKEEQHNIDKVEQQHIDTYQENKKGKGKEEHKLFEVSN
jgi:hypothetical protein